MKITQHSFLLCFTLKHNKAYKINNKVKISTMPGFLLIFTMVDFDVYVFNK
jgi:type IV secretory pathway TrbL component